MRWPMQFVYKLIKAALIEILFDYPSYYKFKILAKRSPQSPL